MAAMTGTSPALSTTFAKQLSLTPSSAHSSGTCALCERSGSEKKQRPVPREAVRECCCWVGTGCRGVRERRFEYVAWEINEGCGGCWSRGKVTLEEYMDSRREGDSTDVISEAARLWKGLLGQTNGLWKRRDGRQARGCARRTEAYFWELVSGPQCGEETERNAERIPEQRRSNKVERMGSYIELIKKYFLL